MSTPFASYGVHHAAQIGISVEPLVQLAGQTPAGNTTPSSVETFAEFTKKMLESFYNYASSFAVTQPQMTPNPTQTFVPLSTLTSWFSNFERKLQQNPYFWRSWNSLNFKLVLCKLYAIGFCLLAWCLLLFHLLLYCDWKYGWPLTSSVPGPRVLATTNSIWIFAIMYSVNEIFCFSFTLLEATEGTEEIWSFNSV